MPGANYTSEAENDLRQITQYIAKDNLLAALLWLDQIRATCDLLATQPSVGERMQTTRFGEARRHVVGNYLIYFQPTADGIEVVRIVHGAREQGPLV